MGCCWRRAHRVERCSIAETDATLLAVRWEPARAFGRYRRDAIRHALEVAVGLDSVVLAEDQVLSAARGAVASARDRGALDLRILAPDGYSRCVPAGGHAAGFRHNVPRSPTSRSTGLAIALDGRRVLVIGAGRMGELAARAALRRGALVTVASRTPARAAALAARLGADASPFDPGVAIARYAAVVVALSGGWRIDAATGRRARVGANGRDRSFISACGSRSAAHVARRPFPFDRRPCVR